MTIALPFVWDAENAVMRLDPRYRKQALRQYVNGDTYELDLFERRSLKSLRHYHVSVKNIWENLPDDLIKRWDKMADDGVWNISPALSPDILRKWALIKCGYLKKRTIVCETPAHAKRWIKNMYDDEDPFTIVTLEAATINIYRARSQSMHGHDRMTGDEFKESKNAVLDLLGSLIGVRRTEIEKHSRTA